MKNKNLLNKIKENGGRLTKVKIALLNLLEKQGCPITLVQISAGLKKAKISADRTTVYRELKFLMENKIVEKIVLGGVEYYELISEHHHHLVCLKCRKIEEVFLDNHLENQEKKLAKKSGFKITGHALEFFGFCKKCN